MAEKKKPSMTRAEILVAYMSGQMPAEEAAGRLGVTMDQLTRDRSRPLHESLQLSHQKLEGGNVTSALVNLTQRADEVYEYALAAGKFDIALNAVSVNAGLVGQIAKANGLEEGLQRATQVGTINVAQLNMQNVIAIPGLNLGRPVSLAPAAPAVIEAEVSDGPQD